MIDPQLKRGLLEICVLAVLNKSDSYGYKIIQDMQDHVVISESTLYPILRRLQASGSLTENSVAYNGRLRKFYRITDEGRRQIADFLSNWTEVEKMFDFIKEGYGNGKK